MAELVKRLAWIGVTKSRLKNDVNDRFLPAPRMAPSGDGRSRVGYWSPAAVTRVRRLYRLRRRGAKGEVLRLLLFLADGWGWEHVRETCRTGVERATAMSLSGLGQYARGGQPDPFAIDAIRAHQHAPLVRALGVVEGLQQTSEPMTRFYLGMLKDGVPLEGGSARSLLEPVLKSFVPETSPDEADVGTMMFEVLTTLLDLRAERLVQRVRRLARRTLSVRDWGLGRSCTTSAASPAGPPLPSNAARRSTC